MNKKHLVSAVLALFISSAAWADKPEWAGKGNPTDDQKAAHKAAMQDKNNLDGGMDKEKLKKTKDKYRKDRAHDASDSDDHRDRGKYREDRAHDAADSDDHRDRERYRKERAHDAADSDEYKGLEKQRVKKSEQEQKELGRGSAQGQESREDRKKWWRFWGE